MRVRTLTLRKGWMVAEAHTEVYGVAACSPENVARLFAFLADAPREEIWVALLNGKHRVIGIHQVSVGTLTHSLAHPREVFCAAIHAGAAAIIAVHNHPSGDPQPSEEDVAITRRLAAAGSLLGIPLLDHVVLGDPEGGHGGFVSLYEQMGGFA